MCKTVASSPQIGLAPVPRFYSVHLAVDQASNQVSSLMSLLPSNRSREHGFLAACVGRNGLRAARLEEKRFVHFIFGV